MNHNKASLQISGECSSVDEAVTKDWHKNVEQIMKQYAAQNTFYMKLITLLIPNICKSKYSKAMFYAFLL